MHLRMTHRPLISILVTLGITSGCVDSDDDNERIEDASTPAADAATDVSTNSSVASTAGTSTTSGTTDATSSSSTSQSTSVATTGQSSSDPDAGVGPWDDGGDFDASATDTSFNPLIDAGSASTSVSVSDASDTSIVVSDASNVSMDAGDGSESSIDAATADASIDIFPSQAAIDNAWVPDGFVAWEWASNLQEPRGIIIDPEGMVLVAEEGNVVALWDIDANGVSDEQERVTIATAPGLNHGIALSGGYLYASSASTVYRWLYDAPREDLGTAAEVITEIPTGGHSTRTLLFDNEYLYVSVGSEANVDPDSSRAQIRRFPIADLTQPRAFYDGELFADGLRNEVGLAIDSFGQVWGVENGMDNLTDANLGGDIHLNNPGEELNLFLEPGDFYGYPYCWSEASLGEGLGMGPGTQWWLESSDENYSDAWCQDPSNVVPPALVLPAHVAPLDIEFYSGTNFPSEYSGDALITFHGSWNTEPPSGYKVVRVKMDGNGYPTGEWEPLYQYSGGADTGPDWSERPVGLAVMLDGTVLVTSDDDADRIIAIRYIGQN